MSQLTNAAVRSSVPFFFTVSSFLIGDNWFLVGSGKFVGCRHVDTWKDAFVFRKLAVNVVGM
jgi:hypothetical protein